jgi:hypothetical protein
MPKDSYEGWEKANRHYWLADYRGWVEFFMSQVFTEPHSSKQREDGAAWGLEITAETLLLTGLGVAEPDVAAAEAVCRQVRCPVPIVHGDQDAVVPYETGAALAQWTGGQLVTIRGGGHASTMRDPVQANLLIRGFAESLGPSVPTSRTWTRARHRRQRVLYVSSPIGLGHARRDLAIADELRLLRPGLEVHWLAQHPVTELLKRRGELINPASAFLASESGHIESEATEHDLHAFQAIRNMDETLIANFMVFHDLVTSEDFDLWVGDEAWDIDYFLHENPELRSPASRACGTARSSSATRTTWCRTRSARGCRSSATGWRRTTGSLATSRASRPVSSTTARRSGLDWATGTASRSAWSRSAVPASAPTCSAGP